MKFISSELSESGFERIYHLHIRKCAGTSLNLAIIKAIGGKQETYSELASARDNVLIVNDKPIVGWNVKRINAERFYYAFSHAPLHTLNLSPTTFTFTVLRDPIERIVSHFRMLKDLIALGGEHPALKKEEAWAFGDFRHFITNIPRIHLERQLYTFSSQFDVDEAIENISSINLVRDVSSVASISVYLEKEFGLETDYAPARRSKFTANLDEGELAGLRELIPNELAFYARAKLQLGLTN